MYKSSEKVSVITERIRLKAHNGFFISLNQNAERGVFISWDVVPKHARSYKDTPFLDSHCMESSLFIVRYLEIPKDQIESLLKQAGEVNLDGATSNTLVITDVTDLDNPMEEV